MPAHDLIANPEPLVRLAAISVAATGAAVNCTTVCGKLYEYAKLDGHQLARVHAACVCAAPQALVAEDA